MFWAYAVLGVASVLVSLYFLNKGQAHFRQTLIVPVYFCVFSTLSVLSANLFYDEFADPEFRVAPYVVGLLALVGGVLLFSLPPSFEPRRALDNARRRLRGEAAGERAAASVK